MAAFFYFMGLAVKKAASRRKTKLPPLTPENLQAIPAFTIRYIEKLYGCLRPPFVIVFDNYQQTPHASGFHEIIRHCLEVLPEGIHAILISREDPPPEFARLCVNRAVSFLGADELRFTLEESQNLARLNGGRELSGDALRLIHERARGWAAGLLLMMEDTAGKGMDKPVHAGQAPQRLFDSMIMAHDSFKPLDRWIDWLEERIGSTPAFPFITRFTGGYTEH